METYNYFIMEDEKLDLAYIVLVRYSRARDLEFDGQCLSNSFSTGNKAGTNLLVFFQR